MFKRFVNWIWPSIRGRVDTIAPIVIVWFHGLFFVGIACVLYRLVVWFFTRQPIP